MRRNTQWTLVVGVAALLAASVNACEKPKAVLAERPECPHSWASYFDSTVYNIHAVKLTPISSNQFSLPGAITDVPEFHDCQRLISVGNAGEYGELAAVFARVNLDGAFELRKALKRPGLVREPSGRIRQVSAGAPGPNPVYSTDEKVVSEGIAVAEVVSERDYKPLGIGGGFNCLFLDGSGADWSAVMVFVGAKEVKCDGLAPTADMVVTKLWVKTEPVGTSPTDVPPVARWDFDSKHGVQLVGIMCDDRWCDVGPQADFEAPVPAGDATKPKQQRIKGWYDEQRVAEYDNTTGKVTKPGHAIATVIPDKELGNYTITGFERPDVKWLPVARVALSEASSAYEAKYGFKPVPSSKPMAEMTHVYLCKGEADRCQIPPTEVTLRGKCVLNPRWWAKIQHGSDKPKYYCVKYRDYPLGFAIPAVVRWRWRANDETIWISCPAGCCETDSFDNK